MKVFGIIPARFASTRFPGKPLARLNGKCMIEWVYRRAVQAFDPVFVATDDETIADEVTNFGGQVVMTSPAHPSGTDRCAEALDLMQERLGEEAEVVVNIQGDEPFVDPDLLIRLAGCFKSPETQIATVIKPLENYNDLFNPNCVKTIISKNGQAIYFSRSPIPYIRGYEKTEWLHQHVFYHHLGLYAYRADVLRQITELAPSPLEVAESLEQNRWVENEFRIKTISTDTKTIAIDTPEDLTRAMQWMENKHIIF